MALHLSILLLRNQDQIEALEQRGYFTDMFESDGSKWRLSQVALLVSELESEPSIVGVGLATRDPNRVATGWNRLRYEPRRSIEPLPIEELLQSVPKRRWAAVENRLSHGGPLSPKAAESVQKALVELRPELSGVLERLAEPRDKRLGLSGRAKQAAIQEADSVRLALDFAGVNRSELMGLSADGSSSFVSQLSGLRASEDTTIAYDGARFLDFDRVDDPSGVVEFSLGGERLIVMNVNRQPLEKTTGADLIYFNEPANSYVLVQYKTMREVESDPPQYAYRPDDQLREELKRMRDFNSGSPDDSVQGYRLGPESCFLKLCKPVAEPSEARLPVKGIYLPIDYYDALIKSPQVRGPRGGIRLGYETIPRRIANTLFVELVRGGWIGSRGATSELLTELVLSGLTTGRTVTFAAKSAADPLRTSSFEPGDGDTPF